MVVIQQKCTQWKTAPNWSITEALLTKLENRPFPIDLLQVGLIEATFGRPLGQWKHLMEPNDVKHLDRRPWPYVPMYTSPTCPKRPVRERSNVFGDPNLLWCGKWDENQPNRILSELRRDYIANYEHPGTSNFQRCSSQRILRWKTTHDTSGMWSETSCNDRRIFKTGD